MMRAGIGWLLWMAVGTYALIAMFFQTLPPELPWQPAVAVVSGFAILAVLSFFTRQLNTVFTRSGALLARVPVPVWLVGCIVGGVLLRIAANVAFPTELVSDLAVYWDQARRLAETGSYGIDGYRIFWPPGFPFFLLPAIAVFGPQPWIPLVLNLVLFCGTILVAFRLAVLALDETAAKLAVLILAIWPNLVFLTGGPQKEFLTAFLLLAAMLGYIEAARMRGRRPLRFALLAVSGFCLGYAGLTQPATLLFGIVFVGYEIVARAPGRQAFLRLGIAALVAILTVLPWTVRNYRIYHAFIPVNTAGGIVFYSANNPNATGGWIDADFYLDEAFQGAGELEANRLGYERGMAWISANKARFVKLAVIKQTRFLCCDSFGAVSLFLHPQRQAPANPALGNFAVTVSNGFWLVLWLAVLAGGIRLRGVDDRASAEVAILPLAVIYFLVIFSVFQSEGKHHLNLAGVIAIMAASVVVRVPKEQHPVS